MKYILLLLIPSMALSGCIGATGGTNRYGTATCSKTTEQQATRYRRRYYPKQITDNQPKQKTIRYDNNEQYKEWRKHYEIKKYKR